MKNYPYIAKVSVGNIFIFKELLSDDNLIIFADVVIYLNAVGILYVLFHSIYLRKMLKEYNSELD
jgi:hypothetical protein